MNKIQDVLVKGVLKIQNTVEDLGVEVTQDDLTLEERVELLEEKFQEVCFMLGL